MCEYLRTEARYNTADKKGQTRREYNAKFGIESPVADPPAMGGYLLEWLRDAGTGRKWDNGYPCYIPMAEWQAWAEISGHIVRQEEMTILRKMDRALVNAMSEELSYQRQREQN